MMRSTALFAFIAALAPASAIAHELISPPPPQAAMFGFGVEHILSGFDHLLFLFVLLLASRTWRSIVAVVSAFTLGHTLSLVAATLGWLSIQGDWVEPAIAATIVYAAARNAVIWRAGKGLRGGLVEDGRQVATLALAFGVVHGLGFAGALAEMGVASAEGLGSRLLLFNLGVEAGQLAVAGIALPALWLLRRIQPFALHGEFACSLAAALVGLYWMVERTLFV